MHRNLDRNRTAPDDPLAAPTNRAIRPANRTARAKSAGIARAAPYIRRRIMGLVIVFLLGIGNFTLHKAVMESGHPLLGRMPWFYHALGGRFSLAVEFLMLLAALLFVAQGVLTAGVVYIVYSMLNSFSAWLILTGRI